MGESPGKDPRTSDDVVMIVGQSERGSLQAVRKRGEEIGLTQLRPVRSGQPIHGGEVVSLKERTGSPVLWDVEVLWSTEEPVAADPPPSQRKGPVRVSNARYREGWDIIFGTPDTSELN